MYAEKHSDEQALELNVIYSELREAPDKAQAIEALLRDRRIAGEPGRKTVKKLIEQIAADTGFSPAAEMERILNRLLAVDGLEIGPNNGALSMAILRSNVAAAEVLLRDGRFNPDAHGFPSIARAILICPEMAPKLLDAGADPTRDGDAALRFAVDCGDAALVSKILRHPRVNVNVLDFNEGYGQRSLLEKAAARGDAEIVQMFIADPRFNAVAQSHFAIVRAVRGGHVEALRALLADPRRRFNPGPLGNHLLYEAIEGGNPQIMRVLLEDPRVNPSSPMLLRAAAETGRTAIVREMLHHFRVDSGANGNAALRAAVKAEHLDVVRMLLNDPGINALKLTKVLLAARSAEMLDVLLSHPRIKYEPNHRTINRAIEGYYRNDTTLLKRMLDVPELIVNPNNPAIIRNIETNQVGLVKLLLEDGRFNPDADGRASLYSAFFNADRNNLEIVRLLLTDGRADPSLHNNYAICAAALFPDTWVLEALMKDPRTNPSARNNEPLKAAVRSGRFDYVGLLLRDPRVRDEGHSAITHYARQGDFFHVMAILASWREPDRRDTAAAVARAAATDPDLRRNIRIMMEPGNRQNHRFFNCLAALLPLNIDPSLAYCIALQANMGRTFSAAALTRLHAHGKLEPIAERLFGNALSTSFETTFHNEYRSLANLAMAGKGDADVRDRVGNNLDSHTAMPLIARSLVSNMPQSAAELLWTIARESGDPQAHPPVERFGFALAQHFLVEARESLRQLNTHEVARYRIQRKESRLQRKVAELNR